MFNMSLLATEAERQKQVPAAKNCPFLKIHHAAMKYESNSYREAHGKEVLDWSRSRARQSSLGRGL